MSLVFKECVEHSKNDKDLKACYSLMMDYFLFYMDWGGGGVVHSLVISEDIVG